jgi:hypothetical protein
MVLLQPLLQLTLDHILLLGHLPELAFQELYLLILILVHHIQKLDVVVCLSQFCLEISNFFLSFVELDHLRVNVLRRKIGNQTCSGCIVQCTQILFYEPVRWRQTCNHEGIAVSSQTLLEQLCQLALSIWNEAHVVDVSFCFGKGRDNLSEHEQTLVDIDTLFGLLSSCASEALLL